MILAGMKNMRFDELQKLQDCAGAKPQLKRATALLGKGGY